MSPGPRCARPGRQLKKELAAGIAVSFSRATKGDTVMVIGIAHLQPIVAIIAGILILIIPRLLNIIVAVYLIVFGILGLGLFK
jgi:hypothetical protein